MTKDKNVDMITLGLVYNFLYSVVDEMTLGLVRTSFTPLCRDAFDFQCGLCSNNENSEMLMEGEGTLLHSLVYTNLIRNWTRENKDNIYPGDFIITNDPYSEAAHLPDVYGWYPIFVNNKVAAWAVAGGHTSDVGGSTPGSCACDNTEIYQEGLRIPPLKLYEKGVPNQTLFKIIRTMSRTPDLLIGDIEAYRTACQIGERRFVELADRYGWGSLKKYLDFLLDYAEKLMRAEIKAMPDGEYEFTDYMDDDGIDRDKLIKIYLKISKKGEEIIYDFTGTSPQVKGAINMPFASLKAVVITALRNMTNPDIPRNSGVFRPVKVIAPPGSLLNPQLPAAVAGRGVTFSRLADVLLGAEAKIVPNKIPACCAGNDSLVMIGGRNKDGSPFIIGETNWGGWGGRPYADGVDFCTPAFSNASNQPCETNEDIYPMIRYGQYSLVPDTEGAGKYRGSLSVARDWIFLGDEAVMQLRTDRQKVPPYGLQGGLPGALSKSIVNPGTDDLNIPKTTIKLKKGDVFRLLTQGGGGWGNPLDRDPDMVLNDVHTEKVSIKRARDLYGVIIDKKTMRIDVDATQNLRTEKRKYSSSMTTREPK